jgi:hypothetical protein
VASNLFNDLGWGKSEGENRVNEKSALDEGAYMASLTDQEIAILCDVGGGGKVSTAHQHLFAGLIANGFVEVAGDETSAKYKLTAKSQQILSERGVGLNES